MSAPAAALAAGLGLSVESEHGLDRVAVPPARWVEAATAARDDHGFDLFGWLGGVDHGADGVEAVLHLWSTSARSAVVLRATLTAALPTLSHLYAGAAWSERELSEMFGITLDGHPDPRPLLLPDAFDGHPLRRDFVLAARVAKAWPGAKEPGESGGRPPRRRARPLGVPPADSWPPSPAEPS